MKRIFVLLAVPVLLASLAIQPAGAAGKRGTVTAAGAKKTFTVGLVTDVGGLNDKSFNHLAYLGLLAAKHRYGVLTRVVESHAQTDYVPNLTHFAQQHTGLTIAVGFLMQSAIYAVAKAYPRQKFAIIDGAPNDAKGNVVNLSNVANLFFNEQESGYLVGVIAGLMEKNKVGHATHNTIGYMGGLSIPPVNRYIAGYVAGAKKVDPTIKILGGYSQSFTDQGKGKSIGLTQVSSGADVLFQVAGASGLGYLAAAQQRNVYGIGVDADQGYLGQYVITSALKKVDVAVRRTIRAAQTGYFQAGDHHFSLKNSATGFAKPSSVVPASIVAQARMYERMIRQGQIVPPTTISSS